MEKQRNSKKSRKRKTISDINGQNISENMINKTREDPNSISTSTLLNITSRKRSKFSHFTLDV